ncbi:hypothetical protein ACHQM5_000008 [Ranunculus cassubicifolius]
MSEFIVKSPKHCAKQGLSGVKKLNKKLWYGLLTFSVSLLSLIFLVYLLLHPSKPEFYLREANLYQLNLSRDLVNSSVQITLVTKNPNQKVGVYYDQLQLYASYKGQQITTQVYLPPFYQGHQDDNILTAFLNGSGLPVASSFGYEVSRDQTAGTLVLNLKINGQVRWRVGSWVSSRYRLNVDCVVVMAFPNFVPGSGGPLNSNKITQCSSAV